MTQQTFVEPAYVKFLDEIIKNQTKDGKTQFSFSIDFRGNVVIFDVMDSDFMRVEEGACPTFGDAVISVYNILSEEYPHLEWSYNK